MAKIHGVAGEWARVKGTVAGLWPLFLGVFAAGVSLAVMFIHPRTGLFAMVIVLGYIGWSLSRGLKHVERFFKGARGEEQVSQILKSLPEDYHVFNDFVAMRNHVDHVVVGPAGVFAVETKFWRGSVTLEEGHILLDGQLPSRSPLSQVRTEAEAVRAVLEKKGWKGTVTPVLVFASNTFEAKIAELSGAVIINSNHIMESFRVEKVVLPPAELTRLVSLMETDR